jgi:hypothetical protein
LNHAPEGAFTTGTRLVFAPINQERVGTARFEIAKTIAILPGQTVLYVLLGSL